MASADYFLKIDGIPGESLDREHRGSIEVLSWSWGERNADADDDAGSTGGAIARPSMSPVEFSKRIDKATPLLMTAASTGKHWPKVELQVRKGGSKPFHYMKVTFTDCLVSSIQGSTAEPRLPVERIGFNFQKVEIEVQQFTPNRLIGSPVKGEFVEQSDAAT
jgi:type VI secretion system secreted protein Hcp